jgi:hypothetical protein
MCPRISLLRKVVAVAVLAGSFLTAAPLRADEKVYARAVKSTVLVEAPKSLGAGTLIDAGQRLVVTANHVVANGEEVNVYFAAADTEGRPVTSLKHYADNQVRLRIKGTVVGRLERCDLALIQLASLPPGAAVTPVAAEGARPGQEVHVLGHSSILRGAVFNYSGGGKVRNVVDMKINLTLQNVEGKPTRTFEGRIIETDVVTREGDSGGPVVNDAGELVGVVSGTVGAPTKENQPGEPQVNMSIDVSEVKALLKAGGFNVLAADPPLAKAKTTDAAPTEKAPARPKPPALVGGIWKQPATDSKGRKFIFQLEFAADGSYRLTKVGEDGGAVETLRGRYELAGDTLTLMVDDQVRVRLRIRLVDDNRMTARHDGGEAVTWRR